MAMLFPGKYLTVASSVSLPSALSPISQSRVGYALFKQRFEISDVMLQNIPMANVPFQEWIDAIADGTMNANLDRTFKLEEAGKAHEYMQANKVSTSSFVTPPKCGIFIFMLFCCGGGAFVSS